MNIKNINFTDALEEKYLAYAVGHHPMEGVSQRCTIGQAGSS